MIRKFTKFQKFEMEMVAMNYSIIMSRRRCTSLSASVSKMRLTSQQPVGAHFFKWLHHLQLY